MRQAVLAATLVIAVTNVTVAQQFTPHVAHPAFTEGTGPRVLFDTAHFNGHHAEWMTPSLGLFGKDGFRVTFQNDRWIASSFSETDILIVAGPLAVNRDSLIAKGTAHYWWSDEGRKDAFTSEEILAVVQWIRGGGSLLVIVDHAPSAAAARMLFEALGVEARNSMTWDGGRRPPDYSQTDNQVASNILFSREHGTLGQHPILEGRNAAERIDRVATYVGSSVSGPIGASPLLILSADAFDYFRDPPERGGEVHRIPAAGRAQAIAFSLDKGRVVVVAEYTVFHATWGGPGDPDGKIGKGLAYAGADGQRFVLNIMRWLARVIP